MKKEIIHTLQKHGTIMDVGRDRLEMQLPSDEGKESGSLAMIFLNEGIILNLIRINSYQIPKSLEDNFGELKAIKINYCNEGRCELQLKSGECTYLTAGEIAIDTGQTSSSYFYPTAEYNGFELIVFESAIQGTDQSGGYVESGFRQIFERMKDEPYPWIRKTGKHIADFYASLLLYADPDYGRELLLVKCTELLLYLSKLNQKEGKIKRTYCTPSQAEIAKRTRNIICDDLSLRHTARELASSFGISETSLKSYFSNVYGCGYAEFQHRRRMEKAAEYLESGNDRISDIALKVGFASQTKFGVAFKECFGVTPLEYRRKRRLEADRSAVE